jgi:APA family basic amino acid/polyamine antiporter
LISAFGLALIPILWTYGGWQENVFVAGETKESGKSLPFALLGTVFLVGSVYLLLNVIFLYLIPADKMASSSMVAADVLDLLFGSSGGKVLAALVVLSCLSAINAMIITGSRVTYAMAQDVPLFKMFAASSQDMTPKRALLLNAFGACVFVILGSFDRLLFFTGIAVWLFFAFTTACVFIFRKNYPDLERPFVVPFYPWLPGLFILSCLGLCFNTLVTYPQQSLWGLGLVATGAPIFWLSQYLVKKGVLKQGREET